MTEKSLVDFTNALAAKEPVPGGGGASAMVGALAIALGSMVGEYTKGNKKYESVHEDMERLLIEAGKLREEFLELIEADAKAFEPLSKAYSVSKEDPNRADLLEAATMCALEPPLNMVRACGRAIDILDEMSKKGSKMLISDAGCGAAFAGAAMKSAAINVFVNTATLLDRDRAKEIEEEVDNILEKYIQVAETIVSSVNMRIRK